MKALNITENTPETRLLIYEVLVEELDYSISSKKNITLCRTIFYMLQLKQYDIPLDPYHKRLHNYPELRKVAPSNYRRKNTSEYWVKLNPTTNREERLSMEDKKERVLKAIKLVKEKIK